MSDENGQGGEKSHDPTEQRLLDARKKGDIARSNDVSAFAAYLGLLIALGMFGEAAVMDAGAVLSSLLSRADTLSSRLLAEGGGAISLGLVGDALGGIAFLIAVPFLLVLGALLAQRAIVAVPDKLEPKLSRISPLEQAKQKFGITGLFEFGKSTVKLIIISIVLGVFLATQMELLVGLVRATPKSVPGEMMQLCIQLLLQITLVMMVIAAVDYMWQQFDHRRKLRMSYQDLKEEAKTSEGDPALKSKRRQRAQEIATNRMMTEVPQASVVIVN
ncbi:MAG: EscU/YscU/HrcU family type III secretion system export apparatus switch protein, partial [Pseudomonadota bacterium]